MGLILFDALVIELGGIIKKPFKLAVTPVCEELQAFRTRGL